MKTLSRHKTFIKDMRTVRLTEAQATKLFLYEMMSLYRRKRKSMFYKANGATLGSCISVVICC